MDVRDGRSEPGLGVFIRADGSELEFEVKGTVLDHQGRRFLVHVVRDITERQRQARQAAALAQAAASLSANDSIDAILEAISECALAGTRALAAWVKLDDEDHVARWVGAAGVPDGFREHLRSEGSEGSATCARFMDQEAMAAPVVVYADWRQQLERWLGTTCPLNWQGAAIARLLYRGAAVGLLTAIYREGEMPYAAETTFLAALADQAAMAAANARLLAAAREKATLEERQRLARELHDSVSQSLYGIQVGATMARERLEQDPAGAAQIDHVLRLAEASQAEMRALIFALRPEALETEGLVAALNRQIEALRARHGIAAQAIAGAEPELPPRSSRHCTGSARRPSGTCSSTPTPGVWTSGWSRTETRWIWRSRTTASGSTPTGASLGTWACAQCTSVRSGPAARSGSLVRLVGALES